MSTYYDALIAEHARDTRCPHIHGYTVGATTCPVILDLMQMKDRQPARSDEAREGE